MLLTTQYLDEADRLADRIAVSTTASVIAEGTSDELKDRVGGERLEVALASEADADAPASVARPLADGEPRRRPTARTSALAAPVARA